MSRPSMSRTAPSSARRMRRVLGVAVAAATGVLTVAAFTHAPQVSAADDTEVSVDEAAYRVCAEAPVDAAGVDSFTVDAPVTGFVEARITASGDWDLAVFDEQDDVVAGSAGFGGREVATGFIDETTELTVQACLLDGEPGSTSVDLTFLELDDDEPTTSSMVEVDTPKRADKERLQQLDLDLTEHAEDDSVTVVLHGEQDVSTLREAGFSYETVVEDLAAESRADRAADEQFAAAVQESDLPSGRTTYRRLFDYEAEMKELVREYPDLVRPLTLDHLTVEGREVHGIEITTDVDDVHDGKPMFLHMGTHHAREWPAAEHTMEWAYELLNGYGDGGEFEELVGDTRTVVVPVINPDGFAISREAATTGSFGQFDYDMKRSNCSISENAPPEYQVGECADNPAGRLRGTDLNRNYGGFWGGPGASPIWSSDTYRGDGPFSEPEVQNVRDFHASRPVTTLISNHTFGNLWLRPPGVAETRPPLEKPLYEALGEKAAAHNGYDNIPSYELYDTTGGTEDWTFWTAGSLGFTPEIGTEGFHPPFEVGVVAEYLGREPAEGAGQGGNSAAYLEVQRATADPQYHSRITGRSPSGHTLTVRKDFMTATSPVVQPDGSVGDPILFPDSVESSYETDGREFSFAVNPSTRPVIAGRWGRDPTGPPQPGMDLENPPGIPEENKDLSFDGPLETTTFTVEDGEYDNAFAEVSVGWGNAETDWDVYVEGPDGEIVGSAATLNDPEEVLLRDPVPGEYTVYIFNYDQADPDNPDDWTGSVDFRGPDPKEIGETEPWILTCTDPSGKVRNVEEVVVDRGESVDVGNACRPSRGEG